MATNTGNVQIRLSGYREVLRAFDRTTQEADDIRHVFADVALPMARHATGLAIQAIPKVTIPWSRNRVGVSAGGVYVVPQKRGTRDPRKRRPNFGVMLNTLSYDPTVAHFEPIIHLSVERAIDRLVHTFEEKP
jgi:hypothetical protein